jgi:hypothetical protein
VEEMKRIENGFKSEMKDCEFLNLPFDGSIESDSNWVDNSGIAELTNGIVTRSGVCRNDSESGIFIEFTAANEARNCLVRDSNGD